MNDVLKPLLENELLSEDAKEQIKEAFNAKLEEVKADTENQLREEFAERYEHDKETLVSAVEQMVNEGLKAELAEFAEDRRALADKQVELANEIREARKSAKEDLNKKLNVLENFVLNTLAKELKEFAQDRQAVREAKRDLAKQIRESRVAYKKQLAERVKVLENFVLQNLKKELTEFQQDKKKLVDQRVKMINEGKEKIENTRKEFIRRASTIVESKVNEMLQKEMSQFREDIEASRQKAFGQKIFEEFAAEFKASFFNENAEVRKLKKQLDEANERINKSAKLMEKAEKKVAESEKRQKLAESRAQRSEIMNELLGKLSGKKREVMADLLEGVKTENLREAFRKYVPSVTGGTGESLLASKGKNKPLTENNKKVVTGDKNVKLTEDKEASEENGSAEVVQLENLQRLAGIANEN